MYIQRKTYHVILIEMSGEHDLVSILLRRPELLILIIMTILNKIKLRLFIMLTYHLSSGRLQHTAEPDEPFSSRAPSMLHFLPDGKMNKHPTHSNEKHILDLQQ